MKTIRIMLEWVLILVSCAIFGLAAMDATAAVSPADPYQAEALADPDPPVYTFQSSIAYYDHVLIYAGSDGKIYGYDLDSHDSAVVSDTSSLNPGYSAVQGFLVSADDYLYFHDNALSANIYRLKLTDAWPAAYETLDTAVTGTIFAFTQNPGDDTIWFSSADFGTGSNFYLHQVNSDFKGVTLKLTFTQPNGGGNGPIIFQNDTTLLYGEAVFGGDGYFHQIDTAKGSVVKTNYLVFSAGLGDATRGYKDHIFVTTGGGNSILEINGSKTTLIATVTDEARGIAFDGDAFYVSAMVPFTTGGGDDGKVSLDKLWKKDSGGGGGGCFIDTAGPGHPNPGHGLIYLFF